MLIQISITSKTGAGGVMVERSLGVWKVAGSIPSIDIPKIVKIWYRQIPCLRSALKGEWLEILLVGPVSAYNLTGWGAPVKCLRQEHSSVAALAIIFHIAVFNRLYWYISLTCLHVCIFKYGGTKDFKIYVYVLLRFIHKLKENEIHFFLKLHFIPCLLHCRYHTS